jgi:putative flippase GtrA
MKSKKENILAPFKNDLEASIIIGLLAGLFSTIVLVNLNLFGKEVFGVKLSITVLFVIFLIFCLGGIFMARLASRFWPVIYKFGKFGETGGLNWLVDLGVLNLLILLTGFSTGIYFIIFKGISFVTASTNSYFWNKWWVFRGAAKQDEVKEVGKFFVATTLGMMVNVLLASTIAFLGPHIIGGIDSKTWANIATVCGSLTAMIFNFLIYKIWVFRN